MLTHHLRQADAISMTIFEQQAALSHFEHGLRIVPRQLEGLGERSDGGLVESSRHRRHSRGAGFLRNLKALRRNGVCQSDIEVSCNRLTRRRGGQASRR